MLENIFSQEFVLKNAAAGIVIIVGLIAGRYAAHLVSWLLRKTKKDKAAQKFEKSFKTALRYTIYGLAVIAALNRLGIVDTIFTIILLVIILLVSIGLFFLLRDFISNIFAGFILENRAELIIGKELVSGDTHGKIIKKNPTNIKLETKEGEIVIIPYSFLRKNKFTVLEAEK